MENYNYLISIHQEVKKYLQQLNFNLLWKGFKIYPFAIYDSKYICLDGKILEYNKKFLGNTAINYEGRLVAIWNIQMSPLEDILLLTANIVHEMFHCFQSENQESRYVKDLDLLMYPKLSENFALKFNENLLLIKAFDTKDKQLSQQLLEEFYKYRKYREEIIANNIYFEYKVETTEGCAEYVGLKALRQLSIDKYNQKLIKFIEQLKSEEELLDIRRISYYVAVMYFLCLEKLNINIDKYKLAEAKTIYELFYLDTKDFLNIPKLDFSNFKVFIDKEIIKQKEKIEKFSNSQEIIAKDYKIIGYDPMNMFRLDDYIYCSHFILIANKDNHKMLQQEVLLIMKEKSSNELVSYKLLD